MDKVTNTVNAVLNPVKGVAGQAKSLSTDLVKTSVPVGGLGLITDAFGITNLNLLENVGAALGKIIDALSKSGIDGIYILIAAGVIVALKYGIINLKPTPPVQPPK